MMTFMKKHIINKTKTYDYEDLFEETNDGSGDLILTIPEEWGFNVGDNIKIELIDESLKISKI